jgi:hypothetical protein
VPAGASDRPAIGIEVPVKAAKPAKHRLVTIGDSLTHGFMGIDDHWVIRERAQRDVPADAAAALDGPDPSGHRRR